jgi:hypothetical protein
MSRPAISKIKFNSNLSLAECHPDSECRTNSWWLYDERAGMNIGMREKSRDEAFVSAIEYWAERALRAELCYSHIKSQVDSFVNQFVEPDEEGD